MTRSGAPLPAASPLSPVPPSDRVIRVFISSTFRDMHAEREELLKFVFPKLRHICESRGVVWGEVDLRWGITEEQKAEVVPICLKEIRRCRPYFIGILGERYGSAPDPFPESLVAEESWLERARDRSVTELEILHGVLNDPDMAAQAFFYFRDPAYIESLPERERAVHRETPAGAEKLARLKDRIRASPFPVREDYRDPRDLGRLVLEDMTRLIDTLFPEGEPPDTLGREAAGQEAYIRALSQVYHRPSGRFRRSRPPRGVLRPAAPRHRRAGLRQIRTPGELGEALPGETSRHPRHHPLCPGHLGEPQGGRRCCAGSRPSSAGPSVSTSSPRQTPAA